MSRSPLAIRLGVVVGLLFISALALTRATFAIPKNAQPLSIADIRVHYSAPAAEEDESTSHTLLSLSSVEKLHVLSQFTALSSLSTNDISLLSETQPTDAGDESFVPFGQQVHFAFAPQSAGGGHATQSDEFSLSEFVLDVEDAVVLLNPESPVSMRAQDEDGDIDESESRQYLKQVAYRGSRLNAVVRG